MYINYDLMSPSEIVQYMRMKIYITDEELMIYNLAVDYIIREEASGKVDLPH